MSGLVRGVKKFTGSILGGGVGGLFSNLFGKVAEDPQLQQVLQAPPAVEPPPPMPTPNSAAVKQAQRKSIASQMRRRGRASTILSDDALGGGI